MKLDNQKSELSERLMSLLTKKLGPQKNFFAALEHKTGVDRETWKHWFNKPGVVDPSTKLLTAAFKCWPEHAYWLATGHEDKYFGHVGLKDWRREGPDDSELEKRTRKVVIATDLYVEMQTKAATCEPEEKEHYMKLVEHAEQMRVYEISQLCLEYLNGDKKM